MQKIQLALKETDLSELLVKCFPKHLSLPAAQGTSVWKTQGLGTFPASQHPHHQYPKKTVPASLSITQSSLKKGACKLASIHETLQLWAALLSASSPAFLYQEQPMFTRDQPEESETNFHYDDLPRYVKQQPQSCNTVYRLPSKFRLGTFGYITSNTLFSLYWVGARPNRANKPSDKRNHEAKQKEEKRTAESWIRLTEEMPLPHNIFSVSTLQFTDISALCTWRDIL